MSFLSQVRSYTVAVIRRSSLIIARRCPSQCFFANWNYNFGGKGVRTFDLEHLQARFRVECYATRRGSGGKASRSGQSAHLEAGEGEKDPFFVVRKGDIVGIYKSLNECQSQVGSSVSDPPVSVYKGHSLSKDAKEYLASYGLNNPLYAIHAAELKDDLFGNLKPCLFQDPAMPEIHKTDDGDALLQQSQNVVEPGIELQGSCIIEFDGASRGNPGLAGAGVVLRSEDGTLKQICKLRQGLGVATCNSAEYQAIILGLKYALEKGYRNIHVKGDSKLVCMQMQGLWKVKNENLSLLYDKAKRLQDEFVSFKITHFLRGYNSDADAQANLAACLAEGEIQVDLR